MGYIYNICRHGELVKLTGSGHTTYFFSNVYLCHFNKHYQSINVTVASRVRTLVVRLFTFS